ncbi:MAG: hypothetical protein O3C40_09000 [Planctomycetota bacterium]|nr:hypothetical protein [Planctomycetota bacterium]
MSDCVKFAGRIADSLDQLRVFVSRGANMLPGIEIRRLGFGVAVMCAIAMSGCTAPMIPSQRFHEPELSNMMGGPIQITSHRLGMQDASECASCEDRQRVQDYAPYVAGPFMHRRDELEYTAEQATIQPPHSKFHPVPTRPVFETRTSYQPPQPIGVHLVPVPDQESQPMLPRLYEPDSQFGLPPDPPATMTESTDPGEFDEPDTLMLPPLSN